MAYYNQYQQSHPLLIATPSSPTEKTEFINVMLIDESGSKPSVFGASVGFMTLTKSAIIFDEYLWKKNVNDIYIYIHTWLV